MTVGAARNEISEGLLVRVLADWDMGKAHRARELLRKDLDL